MQAVASSLADSKWNEANGQGHEIFLDFEFRLVNEYVTYCMSVNLGDGLGQTTKTRVRPTLIKYTTNFKVWTGFRTASWFFNPRLSCF